ncbi:unnamed protein product [Caenorhabditis sp. 36 PRJEB53466]|nr:unnamed protein product [Caenorhabditis sp. 36 PRJEB53466]
MDSQHDNRFDVVLYGATGITGGKIFETMIACRKFDEFSVAIAGRNEQKLREVIRKTEATTGASLTERVGVLICETADGASMARMARRSKLIVNAVGPFRLHGEAVVRAAVENGAHQIDVAGEPEWIERMEDKYLERARTSGVYVVSACGWDSIPADLGVAVLKKHFDGQLSRIDAFVHLQFGPSGYSFSATSLHALLLGFNGAAVHGDLGATRRRIMPERLDTDDGHLPRERPTLWRIEEKESAGWALPFPGADKSIVTRSQYNDAVENRVKPVHFTPYSRFETRANAILLAAFMSLLKVAAKYEIVQRFVMRYPSLSSCNLFSDEGPSKQQMREASFSYRFYGYGFGRGDPRTEKPRKKLLVTCTGPDVGYIATSGCVLSSALIILKQKEALPKNGGVYTTATAFGNSRIYQYLADFGIKFDIEMPAKL